MTVRIVWCDLAGRDRGAVVREVLERESPGVRSSFSARGRVGVVALAEGRAVGVDVEDVGAATRLGCLPDGFLAALETARLAGLSGDARERELLRLWTLKEAVAKATGLGLTAPLEDLCVGAGGAVAMAPPWPGGRWEARSIATPPGLVAAVAVKGELGEVRQSRL